MLFQLDILPNNSKLGIWKIEKTIEELHTQLSDQSLLDYRFLSITNNARKLEWLSVRLLIKTLCGEEKTLVYNAAGKPTLADNSFNISISHTKGYVAVLIHPTQIVGLDIENRSERILKLKNKFMHSTELVAIDQTQEALHILLYWSAKETLFKIMPEEAIDFIEHLHISPFVLIEKGSFEANETRSQNKQHFTIQYQVFEDFVLTWTTKLM